ncbi:hypothetical protein DERP_010839 [Dermatophagoides pteronyssinus]|uniref:UDP-glucuronosyltransferase n=1 Tax=Dermatophagoides pteronyssinus TaxID=6956 RepID=A0ABQ8JV32_DERPT|nr:hypothetical protein DERP_010839 [Dermatophagoides pteronyssinus]
MKILFYSMEGIGHVQACLGLANCLGKHRNHQITFMIGSEYQGKFRRYGHDEIILKDDGEDPKMLQKSIVLQHRTPKEKLQLRDNAMFKRIYEKMKRLNNQIDQLITKFDPDLIIIDHFIIPPCIAFHPRIPWIFLFSGCPDFLYNSTELPPLMSGLPSNDRSEWPEYRQLFYEKYQKPLQDLQNELNKDFGYDPYPSTIFFNKSPYLNIYGYPKELDFDDRVEKPENFLQMDSFFDYDPNDYSNYEFPEEFRQKLQTGDRIIYISLGSCGPIDLELMKKIIKSLHQTPYKYIISKGPLHNEFELPSENMWGKSWLNQQKILPKVDLVLFHGGNNTLAECIMHGKPMIVMPLFFDQYSNAQRIEEKQFGIRMDPYQFTKQELINNIEKLLFNEKIIRENLQKASKRIRQTNSVQLACIQLEKLVEETKKKFTEIK